MGSLDNPASGSRNDTRPLCLGRLGDSGIGLDYKIISI